MKFLQFIFNFLFKKSDNQRKKDKPDFYSDDFQLIVNTPVSSETKLNKVQTPIQIKPDIIADKYYPVVIPSVKPNCLSFVSSLNERRIGVSEDVFFSYVFREFHELALNTIVVEKGGVKYEPDIAIIDEENGIYIDIEIDEPYSINGKGELIPTHAIGSDDKRNAFFKDNGWTIIRFSEKQVVMSPKKCLSIIRGVINDSLVFENDFKDKVWSENDSLIMIMNNYRDTYLPNPIFNLSTPRSKSFSTLILEIRLIPTSRDKNRFCMHLINPDPYGGNLKISVPKQEIIRAYNASEVREFPRELISLSMLYDVEKYQEIGQNLIGSYIRVKPVSIHNGWLNTKKIEIIISENNLEIIRGLDDYKRSCIADL